MFYEDIHLEPTLLSLVFGLISIIVTVVVLCWRKYVKKKKPEFNYDLEPCEPHIDLMHIHLSAMRSFQRQAAEQCFMLLQKHPEAVNHALPPFYYTPFLRACNAGCFELVKFMLTIGCSVNCVKQHGYTPLHVAARAGHVNLTRWLLVHGADPERKTERGHRPLDFAKLQGHREVMALLTVNTEEPQCQDWFCTPTCKCDCHVT
ncbi:homeobox protein Wariai-like isoform X2 [Schistocerca gregaria]|uniref:homeobox protein Wariai-like isoform X2 n=1 Tax=Schistocerca gregaria TaxID=7010 RepID=UPI00211EB743|nr:homeobox protein Wariai-like isoform X2 [Schistocerca gregaria]